MLVGQTLGGERLENSTLPTMTVPGTLWPPPHSLALLGSSSEKANDLQAGPQSERLLKLGPE